MTPADYGFVKCTRCGCWRPQAQILHLEQMQGLGNTGQPPLPKKPQCIDSELCDRLKAPEGGAR
jgi:hypothetical protein